ncbi:MAG: hypothetical protein QOD06_894 [Candidatus Binatota bacterium]|nr:hypothetical protein [Candidatus Binatota bacterium]
MSSPKRDPGPEPGPDQPETRDLGALFDVPIDIRSVALTGLFTLATFYTLYFARAFILPVVLAALLAFILGPIVRGAKRQGVPAPLSAGMILVLLMTTVFYGAYALSGPATAWLLTAPESLRQIEYKARAFRRPFDQMAKAADQVQHLTKMGEAAKGVAVKEDSVNVFTQAHDFLGGALVTVILLYFLLASEDLFLRKLVRVLPTLEDKKLALEIAREIEERIAAYLLTVTLINGGLGIVVGIAMYLLGMPNPVLWGVMAAVFNYVPYIGPLTGSVVLALVGVVMFDHLGWALVPPAVYLCFHAVEANLITPALLGRRLELNPIVIFLAVTFWAWLWGIAGALLAVPMLVMFKILCDEIKPLAAVGEFLEP